MQCCTPVKLCSTLLEGVWARAMLYSIEMGVGIVVSRCCFADGVTYLMAKSYGTL